MTFVIAMQSSHAAFASTETVLFRFTATVDHYEFLDSLSADPLGGAVTVGGTLSGTIGYDNTLPDLRRGDPRLGLYDTRDGQVSPSAGFSLLLGPIDFYLSEVLIEVENDRPDPLVPVSIADSFSVRDQLRLPFAEAPAERPRPGPEGSFGINQWTRVVDFSVRQPAFLSTPTLLDSDALPHEAPSLDGIDPTNRHLTLRIADFDLLTTGSGHSSDLLGIEATVTSLAPVPLPPAAGLFALALLSLLPRAHRSLALRQSDAALETAARDG